MFERCFLVLTVVSFTTLALPHGGYWKPDFRKSVCILDQTANVKVSSGINFSVFANFSYKGKDYELSALQDSYQIEKEIHILSFAIPSVFNSSFEKVDYPVEAFMDGEKLSKVEVDGFQYFYVKGKKINAILNHQNKSDVFSVQVKSASGDLHSVDFNHEHFPLAAKMYLTCSENII
ncbi:hypothetical protein [Pseudoalteromonas sp. PPB1]|uniref:hypothetical protein n=1 Tax=Pseudoalteromonas sp. PPB1 TaxID=2756136 RepID=UPI001891A734|nr:hypothetical protein [Pseudoalteromonas sp. PPB1]